MLLLCLLVVVIGGLLRYHCFLLLDGSLRHYEPNVRIDQPPSVLMSAFTISKALKSTKAFVNPFPILTRGHHALQLQYSQFDTDPTAIRLGNTYYNTAKHLEVPVPICYYCSSHLVEFVVARKRLTRVVLSNSTQFFCRELSCSVVVFKVLSKSDSITYTAAR